MHSADVTQDANKKLLLMMGGVGALIVVLLVGAVFVLPRLVPGGISIQLGNTDAGETITAPPPAGVDVGVPVTLGERVVNLADPGGFRYLKTEIVLSLHVPGVVGSELSTEELEKQQATLNARLEPIKPQIQDILTSVLTAKTVAEVTTPEGKEALREQLIESLQPLLRQYQITGLYFAQFVIQ